MVITILITMGAVLGKLTPTQYMVMAAIEVPIAVAMEHFVLRYLKVRHTVHAILFVLHKKLLAVYNSITN